MPGPVLGKRATASIHAAVQDLFDRARARLLGRVWGPKRLEFGAPIIDHREDLSIPGVFDAASKSEGFTPNDKLRGSAVDAVKAYLDAYEARAKHQAVQTVQAAIHDVAHGKLKSGDVHSRLQADLATVMATATSDVKRMAATEVTGARNLGVLDGLVKANTLAGVSDPVVYFVSVKDKSRCEECTELHTIDGVVPRLWFLSEVSSAYHKRGEPFPSVKGLHPHCRCSMVTLLPGWGLNADGRASYVAVGFDAMGTQR